VIIWASGREIIIVKFAVVTERMRNSAVKVIGSIYAKNARVILI